MLSVDPALQRIHESELVMGSLVGCGSFGVVYRWTYTPSTMPALTKASPTPTQSKMARSRCGREKVVFTNTPARGGNPFLL